MKSYQDLYKKAVDASVKNDLKGFIHGDNEAEDMDEHQLDCLLNPAKHPAVVRLAKCTCNNEEKEKCSGVCFYNAISFDQDGNIGISKKNCVGCGDCIDACSQHNLQEIKEVVPIFDMINDENNKVYALIAPAYISQFSPDMTPGKLRSAFKRLGFAGMIEVALFADILTLKEALEFDKEIIDEEDFLLTSCCCPLWVAMIQKVYSRLIPHMPPAVSPMVACGRAIKQLHPDAKTVFIGPCIAKKAEAKQSDVADAVDYVLTFQEVRDIFNAAGIHPEQLAEDLRDHSSEAGRIYARTGGVSEAVKVTVERLMPNRKITLKARQANGVAACKVMLKDVMEGKLDANFLEGMGCVGGCVGGPRALIDMEQGTKNVNEYGKNAAVKSPADNPFVLALLERLGFHTIDSLTEGENMFTRVFQTK